MTYSAAVLALSPLTFLRCSEGSGSTLTDTSGNGHNATFAAGAAAPSWAAALLDSTADPGGAAIEFFGSQSVSLTTPALVSTGGSHDWSVACVFKMTTVGNTNLACWFNWKNAAILTPYSGSSYFNVTGDATCSPQRIVYTSSSGTLYAKSSTTPTPLATSGEVCLFVLSVASGIGTFYFNNVAAVTHYNSANAVTPGAVAGSNNNLGNQAAIAGIGPYWAQGLFSNYAFFNYALTAAQVQDLYIASGLGASNARTSQEALELVTTSLSRARTSQSALELVTTPIPYARTSQVSIEVVANTTPPSKGRTSQLSPELVITEPPATARTSQAALELVAIIPPPNYAHTAQVGIEVPLREPPSTARSSQIALEAVTTGIPPVATVSTAQVGVEAVTVLTPPSNALTSQMALEAIISYPPGTWQDESWYWNIPIIGGS